MSIESTVGYVCFWPDGQMCSCTVGATEAQVKANTENMLAYDWAELERMGYTVRRVKITIGEVVK
jgi:hypothetical protein